MIRRLSICTLKHLYSRNIHTGQAAIKGSLHYLNGKRIDSSSSDAAADIPILYPATGEVLTTLRSANENDVERAVHGAKNAFKNWKSMTGSQRGQLLHKAAQLIRENAAELANIETYDTGKVLWESRADIDGCADTLDYAAGIAGTLSGEHIPLPDGSFAYTIREPLGVVGGIGAWNYPFQMAVFKSAPALACGNTMIFKPSENTPLTAVMLAEIYSEAGVPDGVFNIVQGDKSTGELLTKHPDIAKMSFTGSVDVGAKIMASCAKDIKHVTLELGGKSPLIIFEDCDMDNAVKGAMMANFLTQGQVCSNATRVFVHKSIKNEFMEKLIAKTKSMKIGDPFNPENHVGATINKVQAEKVLNYIEIAKKEGALIECGGERLTPSTELANGYYISPCILNNVTDDMTVAKEEIFGPVMSVMEFEDEDEVVRRANDTIYGLAGGVFTKNLTRAHKVISNLEAGAVYINNFNIVYPQVPFGGFKKSGIGHENGRVVFEYYTQLKAVYVEMNDVWCPF